MTLTTRRPIPLLTLKETRHEIFFDGFSFRLTGKRKKYKNLYLAIIDLAVPHDGEMGDELREFLADKSMLQKAETMYRTEYEQSQGGASVFHVVEGLVEIFDRKLFICMCEITQTMNLWLTGETKDLYLAGPLSELKTCDFASTQLLIQCTQDEIDVIADSYGNYASKIKGAAKTIDKWFSREIYKYTVSARKVVRTMKVISWSNDPTPSQRVLDYDELMEHAILGSDTPAWDEFLNRLSDRDGFMTWCWSLFSGDLETRQVCWLHGGGNDGKSTVSNVFSEFLGPHIVSSFSSKGENQFTNHKFYRKRLAVAPDIKTHSLLTNDLVFRITGGDTLDIEPKNKNSFAAKVTAHFLICSNISPIIDVYSKAYKSRLLYIRVSPVKPTEDESVNFADLNFHDKLLGEMYPFLAKCYDVHKHHALEGNRIPIPPEMEQDIVSHCKHPVLVEAEAFTERLDTGALSIGVNELRVAFLKHLSKMKITFYEGHFELFINYLVIVKGAKVAGSMVEGVGFPE